MDKMSSLLEKSIRAVKEGGIKELLRRTKLYLTIEKNKRLNKHIEMNEKYMDVLFINGCGLPHPARYRVTHQREQLRAGNLLSEEVFYTDLSLESVKYYRVFVFYRCPYTETIGEFIQLAKSLNKRVIFDVDDLVIDTKYTNNIKYLDTMSVAERELYDNGVELMKKTLCMCDSAITTTERLAEELQHYVPEVYINRNVASEEMVKLSKEALYKRDILPFEKREELQGYKKIKEYETAKKAFEKRKEGGVRLGYFSGSITHNDDFQMIMPVIQRLLEKYEALELWIVGELDIPVELQNYKERIISNSFVDWTKLPELIASVDINLAPIEKNIFNEAKSENKWTEAALVKVPTVASRFGAFECMMQHGVTGILCNSEKEWEDELVHLIEDKIYRKQIAENAYNYVKENCVSMYTAYGLVNFITKQMNTNIVFVLPNLQISGGVLVSLKHCEILHQNGWDVTIFSEGYEKNDWIEAGEFKVPVIRKNETAILGRIDKAVATLYSTTDFLMLYPNIKERYYLVQGFETDFFEFGDYGRFRANQTYFSCVNMNYITVSKWCQGWLENRYGQKARYAPNGIKSEQFIPHKRQMKEKVRILVEGNCNDHFKNVDESFRIVELLDKEKYEIWYMSYQGKPKDWYHVDKFLHKIPNKEVGKVYAQCDILLKTSILESFSYPPLEMMATGGYVVAVPNEGNVEYLVDGYNCFFYEQGNLKAAVDKIEELVANNEIREILYTNGIETAQSREWDSLEEDIITLYE